MARMNTTRFALLGMLSLEPSSGYDIKTKMQRSTNYFWSESDGSIYPILKKLLQEEKVTLHHENIDTGKPKKIYTITKKGRDELTEWLEAEPQLMQYRNELLLKIFFGANIKKETIIQHLESFKKRTEKMLHQYQEINCEFKSEKLTQNNLCQWATLKYGIAHSKANISWCDEVIRSLKNDI